MAGMNFRLDRLEEAMRRRLGWADNTPFAADRELIGWARSAGPDHVRRVAAEDGWSGADVAALLAAAAVSDEISN